MREIKFRAWDKEYEKMTYFDDEDYEYKPPFVFRLDQVFKKDSNYDDYEDFEYNDVTNSVEVMQYTGLKDKNGKETYEGDIIQVNDDIKITFDLSDFMYVKYERGAFYLRNKQDNVFDILKSFSVVADIYGNIRGKVVGNIYENKELLNETNRQ